jgi:hypothetical protein
METEIFADFPYRHAETGSGTKTRLKEEAAIFTERSPNILAEKIVNFKGQLRVRGVKIG